MREPVMVEPFDYYSQRGGSKTMNNISNIDLEYNFNNLRNMLQFNRGKMYQMSSDLFIPNLGNAPSSWKNITKEDVNWWVNYVTSHLDEIVDVSITGAQLVFDIATPNTVSVAPFVIDYVEYKRYETNRSEVDDVVACRTDRKKTYEIDSDIYNLAYMPNSIYLWVAPNTAKMYGSGERAMLSNTYAQITSVEVDYGNLSKLMHHYDEKDFFLMALRNGLEDRTYADWTRTNKCFYHTLPVYTDDKYIEKISENEFYGVGSVLRIIPGIDICSGSDLTLVGGMRVSNETIRFHVKYRPLNLVDKDIKMSLFVAFEYNGICTITPGYCDLAMIHIDSFNQIAAAEKAPRYKISRIYGKGLWDKTKKFASRANNFLKKTHLASNIMRNIPIGAVQTMGNIARKAGYGYGGSRSTRMHGGMVIPPGSFYRTY